VRKTAHAGSDCVTTELAEQWLRYGWGPACAARASKAERRRWRRARRRV